MWLLSHCIRWLVGHQLYGNAVLKLVLQRNHCVVLNLTELDGEEYLAGAVDPIAQFTGPIAVQTNHAQS